MQSPEKIREMTQLREKIEQKMDAVKEELLFLEQNLQTIDLILKQSSFTKASNIQSVPDDPTPEIKESPESKASENIQMTNPSNGDVIANAYLTPDKLAIVLDERLDLEQTTPPFQTYFLDKVMADMKKKDSQIQQDDQKTIDYTINKAGSTMREIIIENYRSHQRAMEIIDTATWSLNKMIENTSR